MAQSIKDLLTEKLSPLVRKVSDIVVKIASTECTVLRITTTSRDGGLLGGYDSSVSSTILDNVVLKFPLDEVRMYANAGTQDLDSHSIDIIDLLPIEMKIFYNEDYTTKPVELQEKDIIVHVIEDSSGDLIPIIMEVKKILSGFFGKYEAKRRYELSLVRGEPESDIKTAIRDYINSL